MKDRSLLDTILTVLTLLALGIAQYYIFLVVPNERVMGAVQRVFYFHLSSILATYLCLGVVLIASLYYLATRSSPSDSVAQSSAEVGLVFCTIGLITGMMWGQAAWNTWFRWEPRLVSFLLLWLILVSYNALRFFGDAARIGPQAAVVGILGSLSVPLVVYSVRLLPHTAQLHPQVIEGGGLKHPAYYTALYLSMAGFFLLGALLIQIRYRIARLSHTE